MYNTDNKHEKWVIAFDIETVPDTSVCANLFKDRSISEESEETKIELMKNYHLKITDGKNDFLRQPFHKAVTVSMLLAKVENGERPVLHKIYSLCCSSKTEKEIVGLFFKTLEDLKAKIVSFNGKTFDIPVLKYRAMIHGIRCKYFYEAGSKWEGYSHKYSHNWHCDLLELFSDFNRSASVKMDEVCSIFGFPGKIGSDGGDVYRLYSEGKYQEIAEYCEQDTINTYLLYLKSLHHTGKITSNQYNLCIEELIEYLENSSLNHFDEFLKEWKIFSNGKFFIKTQK